MEMFCSPSRGIHSFIKRKQRLMPNNPPNECSICTSSNIIFHSYKISSERHKFSEFFFFFLRPENPPIFRMWYYWLATFVNENLFSNLSLSLSFILYCFRRSQIYSVFSVLSQNSNVFEILRVDSFWELTSASAIWEHPKMLTADPQFPKDLDVATQWALLN